jgi:hypothetical protein
VAGASPRDARHSLGLDCGGKARTLGDGTHLFRTQLVDKGVDKCLREYKQGKVSGVDNA